ncbi:MAG: ankyrin repeat domain-containing protein [Pirellulaceae bacterium]
MELAIQSHGPHKQSKLLEVCEFLLLSGANPNAYCDYGTMLCFATTIGVNCYFELLKRHGAKVDVFSAAATGDVEDVTTRLRRSSSLARSVDVIGKTPLHYCAGSKVWRDDHLAKERLVKVGKLLLDAGAEINAEFDTPHLHSTPFSYASTLGGNIALAKLLLARGADPGDARLLFDILRSMNRQDDEFSEIAELLLTQGISINDDYVPGRRGDTPLVEPAFVSPTKLADPSSGLTDDFVDLLRLQEGRLVFQFRTPFNQDSIPAPFRMLLIAFVHNFLDGCFPVFETHRMFLFDSGIARWDC